MKAIRQMRILKLKWIKPSTYRREYHLISNEGEQGRGEAGVNNVLAIIRWDKTASSLATAESDDGKWTFKRQGFFHPSVAIKLADRKEDRDDDDLAILHISWDGSGVLEFRGSNNGGSKYWWKRVNYWHTEYTFAKRNEDNDGHILLHFRPEFKFARLEGTVDISQDALLLPEISLLVVLGWYMLVLVGDDRKPF